MFQINFVALDDFRLNFELVLLFMTSSVYLTY